MLVMGRPVQEKKPSAAGRKSKDKEERVVEGPLGVTKRGEGGREAQKNGEAA